MPGESSLPSYEQLFGDVSGRETDESRAVYSPAAYLADLLELVGTSFEPDPLALRRPDLQRVLLDPEHTYTVLPYLDIVDEVLEGRLGESQAEVYERLRHLRFPLDLPFSLRHRLYRAYLDRFKIQGDELYRLFTTRPDGDVVARESLGLSIEDVDAVTTVVTGQPDRFARLDDVTRFRHVTTLSAVEVRELLYGNLGPSERQGASALFVHQGGPCVTLDEQERKLLWDNGKAPIPEDWFDRVARFVRLARKTGMTIGDLDLVLRSCCGNRLDLAALRTLAVVRELQRRLDLPADVVCALAAPMNTLGQGDEDRPRNLFDRVFDPRQTCAGDILAEVNKPYRQWLSRTLGLAEADIQTVVTRYRGRKNPGPFDRGDVGLADLSLLYRISRLGAVLGISVTELFGVLDAMESDPSIAGFPLPIDGAPPSTDCYRMLDAADPGMALWLTQVVVEVVAWMQAHGFAAQELVRILGGATALPSEEDEQTQQSVVDSLREQFDEVGLAPDVFVSQRFSERAAGVIHDVIVTDGTLVSAKDTRLLRVEQATDRTATESVAYDAIVRLSGITEEDFLGLGLDERLTAKIFANLVYTGVLDSTGLLAESGPPADLKLASDFTACRPALFWLIADLCSAGSPMLFPSDLAALGDLTELQQAELYDNLLFNFHVDSDGNILAPDFFTTPENVTVFEVNTHLDELAPAVLAVLRQRVDDFAAEPVALDTSIFTGIGLTEAQLTALQESLRFNGYLNQDGHYTDKNAMLGLALADFGIALEFYPHRRAVLEAMRAQLQTAKAEWLTFAPEDVLDIADLAVASRVTMLLDGTYLVDDHVPEHLRAQLTDPGQDLPLGDGFTAAEHAIVFHQISAILQEQQAYQLTYPALAALGFDDQAGAALVELLVAAGHITAGLTVPFDRIEYFLNVHNALTFGLDGPVDDSKDVFFLLHTVAAQVRSAVDEIAGVLAGQANRQLGALSGTLQDAFGLPAATVESICAEVAGSAGQAMEMLVVPVLAAADTVSTVDSASAANTVTDMHFRLGYRRIHRFALLAAKLGLSTAEIAVAFRDQDLTGKFPEALVLPAGVDHIDALLENPDGTVLIFRDQGYWTYSAPAGLLVSEEPAPLTTLSPRFTGMATVDAAFVEATGTAWIVGKDDSGASKAFTRQAGSLLWTQRDQTWGTVRNNFADPARIDAAFTNADGRTYLFRGDQYIRYSHTDHTYVDEGFPRTVGEWADDEDLHFQAGTDAVLPGRDGKVYLFTQGKYTENGSGERSIAEVWGKVRNTFDGVNGVDCAYVEGQTLVLFSGNQIVRYTDSIENRGVLADEGSPLRIESHFTNLPVGFDSAVDAALADSAGVVHLFKDNKTVALTADDRTVVPTASRWGRLGPVLPSGTVDAAFVGLDGKTYVFSGEKYIRYSGTDYSVVDPGYPRRVAGDWGGLSRVGTAFVLDGRTYLVGTAAGTENHCYVQYSTKNYTTPDTGYPKPVPDNWWSLPAWPAPTDPGFTTVDAVFTGRDSKTYLFSGNHFIVFDNKHRWWSEPRSLEANWDSLPFKQVDAAFVGSDGKTYVFSGGQYVRYSTADYTAVDDRYPAPVSPFWGNVVNNIARTGKVDAALVIDDHTYLFSGDQFVRYTGPEHGEIDSGYPKRLASLKDEPRFSNLAVVLDRVDAAYADQRNVYLFSGKQLLVVSDAPYRRYDLDLPVTGCAFTEDGSVLVEDADGWHRYSSLEGTGVVRSPVRPRTLRAVPQDFRNGLDAVLQGTDGNTYLFKGASCFDTQLDRAYPLAADWGRPRNNVYHDNMVDTAFVGRDGKTYVFSGDQFVVYSGSTYLDAEIVGEPRSVPANWAGLANVTLAYVRDGKTYLFEKPGKDGSIRYVVYSGTDYSVPDDGGPVVTDAGFWQIPADYLPEGFTAPDAVLFAGDTMLALTGEVFLPFNETTRTWAYPRPLTRMWRDFDTVADDDTITAAFTGVDGVTYFFFPHAFTAYQNGSFAARQRIRDRWSRQHNEFAGKDGTGRIDAAVVAGGQTFLFSGSQYVRYSGPGYQWVDAGYPKAIAGNLRQEEMFARLPDSFEDTLAARLTAGETALIDAAVANERTAYLFVGGAVHAVSRTLTAGYDIAMLGKIRNTIAATGKVDTALVIGEHSYLFSGDQFVRYSGADYTFVDDGYPRSLDDLPAELGAAGLPEPFLNRIDAAFRRPDGSTYLFTDKQYVRVGDTDAQAVAGAWGKVRNEFTDGQNGIDAAFVAPTGELYAFRGGQYVRYGEGTLDVVEEGYPRTIKDDWGDLPATFEQAVTGAFGFEGRTYLACGDQFVRYSGADYSLLDRTFPQTFAQRWANCGDYRLRDVHTIVRFVDLARSRATGLADLLLTGAEDPYGYLAGLFGWDVEELRWVKQHDAFLTARADGEYRFEIEFLLTAATLFDLAGKLGAGPSRVFTDIWLRIHGDRASDATVDAANTVLYDLLAAGRDAAEWTALSAEIHDELNLARRDALVSAVTSDPDHPGLDTTQALFEQLLIDVEMGSEARTSRVREAIAAVQLYLHRYLLSLESVTVEPGTDEDATRRRLKRWWTWMRAYRTWEANRKVFLYPENYVRPELRGAKTPAFQQLEDDLLQGEITNDAVSRAYKRYLDEYTEVSRLAIAGGYVHPQDGMDEDAMSVVLFGTTRTDPRRYYYRQAEIRGGTRLSTTWQPWVKVGVQINSDQVAPIHAFGRVFVFWATTDASAPTDGSTSIVAHKDGDTQHVSATAASNRVKICYSFCDLNGDWLPVQTRVVDSKLTGAVSDLTVSVQLAALQAGADHEAIEVSCSYLCTSAATPPVTTQWETKFALPPELYPIPMGETTATVTGEVVNHPVDAHREIFDADPANRMDEARIVTFNSPPGTGEWFSIDHRGGSFLFRPGAVTADERVPLHPLRTKDGFPEWNRIDAAFELPDGTRYLFNNDLSRFVVVSAEGKVGRPESIRRRWRLTSVDGAYVYDGYLYVISGRQLFRYGINVTSDPGTDVSADVTVDPDTVSDAADIASDPAPVLPFPGKPDEGYPRVLPHPIKALFQRHGRMYLFNDREYARTEATHDLDRSLLVWQPVKGNWGGLPAGFDARAGAILDGASELFLFSGNAYARYDKLDAVPRPYERASLPYEIVRLTTGTAHKLNEQLLTGGVAALLDPRTQEYDEVPALSTGHADDTTIHVLPDRVDETRLPASTHLDFDSANGIYYWEIYFHAPLLIAQALNGAQRFEDARQWYDYVFDPTDTRDYWRFLPFLAEDLTALADSCAAGLATLDGCGPVDQAALAKAGLDATTLHGWIDPLLAKVRELAPAFTYNLPLDSDMDADLTTLSSSTTHTDIEQRMTSLGTLTDDVREALDGLREKTAVIAGLRRQYTLLGDPDKLIKAYQDDPFDPHAIAELRPVAYRRAVVMSYIDNLLDWGDMLFRQYTPESIDEARMLYILAYDLLGAPPESLGTQLAPASRDFGDFDPDSGELDPRAVLTGGGALLAGPGSVHAGVANPYFTIPGNSLFADYWVRVEDRLRKIRASQNILGISQPVPLFAPPIDPMALVSAAAGGGGLDGLGSLVPADVPHYRFSFVLRQAQLLVDKARQLGMDLLNVLERRDAEQLSLLQNRQESAILEMTRAVRDAQVTAATENVAELTASQDAASQRVTYYQGLVDNGLSPLETAQLATLSVAGAALLYASANKIAAAFAYGIPQALLGPFIMGTEIGGKQAGKMLDKGTEIWQTLGEGLGVVAEVLGIRAGQQRSQAEWANELALARYDVTQIGHRVASAQQELLVAQRERDILEHEIAQRQEIGAFLKDKFTSAQLYSWVAGQLSETYFQAYNLAHDLARSAERAYQFERGVSESDASHIRPSGWDSRRNGLMAAEGLGLDLDRLSKAYLDTDGRRMEITKQLSLLNWDPVALLRARSDGRCDFTLTEALFDHDFPGHYRRQVRTVVVTFLDSQGEALGVNATLTQLGHKTVLTPDVKAVKYLLDPKGPVPAAVRADWRASQRIALSDVDASTTGSGLFEVRYDDDRYLPFEGTGAVSSWRLELGGDRPADLADVLITVRYTADAGDPVFTNAVKGMLKPRPAARFFDVANEFPQEWTEFRDNGRQTLTLPITPDLLPGMTGGQITGVYTKYQLAAGATAHFVLNGATLTDGALVPTPGLSLNGGWTLRLDGDKQALTDFGLVLAYQAGA